MSLTHLSMAACSNCGLPYGTSSARPEDLPSAVKSLLKSNAAPVQGISSLINLLHEAQRMGSDIDSQIARMQASLVTLLNRRAKIEVQIRSYKTVLHPIRRLPSDILKYIFQLCVEEENLSATISVGLGLQTPEYLPALNCSKFPVRKASSLDSTRNPWLLSQVCRQWRGLALALPTLWSSLTCLGPSTSSNTNGSLGFGSMSLISLQIQRSRDSPLTVICSNISRPFLALVCAHSARWKLFYGLLSPANLAVLGSLVRGYLPLLEVVSIAALTDVIDHGGQNLLHQGALLQAFQFCPRLRCFMASEIPHTHSFSLPWAQLTEFSHCRPRLFDEKSNDESFGVLRKATNLRYAQITCCHPSLQLSGLQTRFFHNNLRGLYLRSGCNVSQDITRFLDRLALPALVEFVLIIGSVTIWTSPFEESILHFLERSSPPLQTFLLPDTDMAHTTSTQLFAALPHVQKFGAYRVAAPSIRALHSRLNAPTKDREVLLPKLEWLALYGPEIDIDPTVLVDLVESRFKPSSAECSSLRVISLPKPFKYEVKIAPRVQTLISAGFNFEARG